VKSQLRSVCDTVLAGHAYLKFQGQWQMNAR